MKGVSPHTMLSYRDGLRLLLRFAAERLKTKADRLTIEKLSEKVIAEFLDHVEKDQGNSARTRNARLAAIRSFFGFVGTQAPEILDMCRSILLIPMKHTEHKSIDYLEEDELNAMFQAVDTSSRMVYRDRALLFLLYNTGARASEIVNLIISDLKLTSPSQVKILGKGRKQRACPLWPDTVEALEDYLEHRRYEGEDSGRLFLNANGRPMTRFGLRHIIRTHAKKAALSCPSLTSKTVSPHTFRHSAAMTMLRAGNDINMVRISLGHAHLNTTHVYAEIDVEMKRKILGTNPPLQSNRPGSSPKWRTPDVLKWLDDLSEQIPLQ